MGLSLLGAVSRRLYLRIWLAVLGSVAVLTFAVGWAWRVAVEYNTPPPTPPTPREVTVRNTQGEVIGGGLIRPRREPGQPVTFAVTLNDGQSLQLELAPRPRRVSPEGRPDGMPPGGALPWVPPWARPPYGFLWMLAIVGLAVAFGVYPVIRRLTQRLEALQRGVQRWGNGDLSVRVPDEGQDEVADLSRRFNAAAQHIESLLASQRTLLESQKSLLANASHELRSPLTRIRMGLELMGTQPAPGLRDELSRNIGELDQLIGEILLASRLDAREADLGSVEPLDLTGLAAEECSRAGAKLDLAEDTPALVMNGVAKLMRRLIRNLLENARRHGDGGIDVTLSRAAGQIVLTVSDQGPGVPPSLRERIFEPFYRLPGASERDGGVGLGLALVKSIAERHGGRVQCADRPGGGASFIVTLPASG
jgi:two-component system, OmpR family, sensor kinase